jgi:hypothetical protein
MYLKPAMIVFADISSNEADGRAVNDRKAPGPAWKIRISDFVHHPAIKI